METRKVVKREKKRTKREKRWKTEMNDDEIYTSHTILTRMGYRSVLFGRLSAGVELSILLFLSQSVS